MPEMTKAKITGSSSGNPILESYVYNERTRHWDERNHPSAQPRGQRNNRPNHENKNQFPIRDVTPPNIEHDDEISGQHRICESGPPIQHTHQNSQNNYNLPTNPNTPVVRCARRSIPEITGARIRGLTGNGEVECFIYNDAMGQWVQRTENNNPDRNLEVRPGAPDHPPPDFHENYQNVHPHHPQYPPHYGGQDGGSGSGHRN